MVSFEYSLYTYHIDGSMEQRASGSHAHSISGLQTVNIFEGFLQLSLGVISTPFMKKIANKTTIIYSQYEQEEQ